MTEFSSTVEAKRTRRWIKTAGIGAMFGGGAVLTASILDNVTELTGTPATIGYMTTWAMFAIGALLLLVGAVAVHARYGEEYGRLGIAGTTIAGLGFLSMTVGGAWSAVLTGAVGNSPAGGLAFAGLLIAAFGSLVLAIALRRAGIAPRAVALLVAAPVAFVATFVVGEALAAIASIDALWLLFLITFFVGWVSLGDALRHSRELAAPEASTPAA